MMLSERQVAVLRAAVDRMIPPDEFPGGWEGGVGDYLFRQFERDLKNHVAIYAHGLDALDAEAKTVAGKAFDELDSEAQDQLLAQIELGHAQTNWPVDPAAFVRMLAQHSAEGYYSDPTHNGGNQGGIAWKMIGFEVTG
jgi:hypothetical protein